MINYKLKGAILVGELFFRLATYIFIMDLIVNDKSISFILKTIIYISGLLFIIKPMLNFIDKLPNTNTEGTE